MQEFVTDLLAQHTQKVEQNIGRHIKAAGDAIVIGPDGWERDPHNGLAKGEYFQLVKRAAYGHMDERLAKIQKSIAAARRRAAGRDHLGRWRICRAGGLRQSAVGRDLVRDDALLGRCFTLTLTTGNSAAAAQG